jgi:hypothetical protein
MVSHFEPFFHLVHVKSEHIRLEGVEAVGPLVVLGDVTDQLFGLGDDGTISSGLTGNLVPETGEN